LILRGRAISPGKAEGRVLKLNGTFSFLGGVNASTGDLNTGEGNVAGKVFVFSGGKGSTVGSFVMYDLMVHGKAPAAVVNRAAETIVTTGAVISSIPMVDRIDIDLLFNGDEVTVNGDEGTVEIKGTRMIRVVSSALLNESGRILLLQRPDNARSFPGTRSLVAGKIEAGEDIESAAVREIFEETQIHVSKPAASMPPIYVREGDIVWEVYPFLFRAGDQEPILNKENVSCGWVAPDEIKNDRSVVPQTNDVVKKMLRSIAGQQ
jgi:predicted aconitase with swiveling domain/8-oxo-dGTP pyrophosphatase MutT (NUDIX family)